NRRLHSGAVVGERMQRRSDRPPGNASRLGMHRPSVSPMGPEQDIAKDCKVNAQEDEPSNRRARKEQEEIMRSLFRNASFLITAAALVLIPACSSTSSRSLDLLGPRPKDAESERLRQMQMVRVMNKVDDQGNLLATPVAAERTPEELEQDLLT